MLIEYTEKEGGAWSLASAHIDDMKKCFDTGVLDTPHIGPVKVAAIRTVGSEKVYDFVLKGRGYSPVRESKHPYRIL